MAYKTHQFNKNDILTHGDMNNIIEGIDSKQDILVSGQTIKTINGVSLLGSGNIAIEEGGGGTSTTSQIELYEQAKMIVSRFQQ